MAQAFKQFRFYASGADKNYPAGLTSYDLTSGTCFSNLSITSLGISAIPGLRFNINNGADICVNSTGVFQLQLEEGDLVNLSFNPSSLSAIEVTGTPLIIDIVYTNS